MARNRMSKEEKRDALRKRNAERDARKAGGIGPFALLDLESFGNPPIFTLEKGYNYIDNIPYEVSSENHPDQIPIGEDDYKLEVWAHRNIGPNNEWILCLKRTFNKKCRCCEERDFLQTKEGGNCTTDDEEVKALTPTLRCFYNIIDVSNDAKTYDVQIFENTGARKPSKWFEALLNEEAKAGRDEPIAWYDLEEGFTIRVRAETDSFQKNEFIKPTRIDFEDRDSYDDSIYEEVYPLDAMLKIPTYEDQCALFDLGQTKDSDSDPDNDEEGENNKRRNRKSRSESSDKDKKRNSRSRRKDSSEEDEDNQRKRSTNRKKDSEEKQSNRRRGRQKNNDDTPEKDDDEIYGTCPYDYTFGVDYNQKDACVDCDDDTWNSCSEACKMVDKEERKRKSSNNKTRSRRRSG